MKIKVMTSDTDINGETLECEPCIIDTDTLEPGKPWGTDWLRFDGSSTLFQIEIA